MKRPPGPIRSVMFAISVRIAPVQAQVSITDVREIQRAESAGKIQRFVPLARE